MTVQTTFYNWQASPIDPTKEPYERCSPNLVLIRDWMNSTWGFKNVGCHVNRDIIVGSTWSDHAYGAAIDQSYAHWSGAASGAGRNRLVNEIIPALIADSYELGIQAIHDYHGQRIWRAWRSASEGGPGWKRITSGQFQPGNLWIHVATPPERWADTTPIATRLEDELNDADKQWIQGEIAKAVDAIFTRPIQTLDTTKTQSHETFIRETHHRTTTGTQDIADVEKKLDQVIAKPPVVIQVTAEELAAAIKLAICPPAA